MNSLTKLSRLTQLGFFLTICLTHELAMMKKRYKVALLFLVLGIGVLVTACATLNSPQFGKLPEQARLERIQQSPNYINDEFAYPEPTPMLREGESTLKIFLGQLLG
ncbi:hypothetical protein BJI56_19000 [Acinetobacter nosocomialis]|nr:hypothetical protein BJI56_19000 [Acinetobacter nosocomialis]